MDVFGLLKRAVVGESLDSVMNAAEPEIAAAWEKFLDRALASPWGHQVRTAYDASPLIGKTIIGASSVLLQGLIRQLNPKPGVAETIAELVADFPKEVRRRLGVEPGKSGGTTTATDDEASDADIAAAVATIKAVMPKGTPQDQIAAATARLQGEFLNWVRGLTPEQAKVACTKAVLPQLAKLGDAAARNDLLAFFSARAAERKAKEQPKDSRSAEDRFREREQQARRRW